MDMDNFQLKNEEVEALSAIYTNEWTTESEAAGIYGIIIKVGHYEVKLEVHLPDNYPIHSPPTFEISAPWMGRNIKKSLINKLNEIYMQHKGEPVIFLWVEKIREVLQNMKKNNKQHKSAVSSDSAHLSVCCPLITHGPVISDRKSKFQGHAAQVRSIDDVKLVLNKLKDNRKIQNAKHNIYAYRIQQNTTKGSTIIQDCDDDGEAHAANRLLYLMELLKQTNTMVVVTRWYGGIHLGPDRFRHINNAARQALNEAGLLKQ